MERARQELQAFNAFPTNRAILDYAIRYPLDRNWPA
jgi:hypothetical protein